MSYLDNLLGGSNNPKDLSRPSVPSTRPSAVPKSRPEVLAQKPAQKPTPNFTPASITSSNKRKIPPESSTSISQPQKLPRTNSNGAASSPSEPSKVSTPVPPARNPRPPTESASKPGLPKPLQRKPTVQSPATVARSTATSSSSSSIATPAAAAAVVSTGPPKKGSFAEIMKRAQSAGPVKSEFRIVHRKDAERKDIDKGKVARTAAQIAKDKAKEERGKGGVAGTGTGTGTGSGVVKGAKEKDRDNKNGRLANVPAKREIPVGSYKGSARPTEGSGFKGTARRDNDRDDGYRDYGRRGRQDSYDDDDEDEDDGEEEERYDSDGSSDMEAGVFDIDEEEELALRAAREEDARHLAEEKLHQQRKMMKKMGRY